MKLYFIRHGESGANTRHIISNRESPFPLTPRGRQQAETLAEKLRGLSIQTIFSSPVLRARETAAILSSALDVPYQVTEALREYDCGILEEKGDAESWEHHRRYFEDWVLRRQYTRKPEGGECFLDIQDRFVPFLESLTRAHSHGDQDILLVSHGGLYLLMLPLVLANIDHSFAVSRGLGNTEYVLAEPGQNGLVCLQWGQEVLA